MSSDEGDIVLDPFVGTGTTAVAAKRLGRAYIGIDIDANYVEITKEKLRQVNPTTLDGCYVSIFLKRIVTIRDKDWNKVKKYFEIPKHSIELERKEIKLKQ